MNEETKKILDSLIEKYCECEGSSECNSFGICSGCMQKVMLTIGFNAGYKVAQKRIKELEQELEDARYEAMGDDL